jgi:hypothetical protein
MALGYLGDFQFFSGSKWGKHLILWSSRGGFATLKLEKKKIRDEYS